MDWLVLKQTGVTLAKKYRFIVLILLAGVLLMCLPEGGTKDNLPEASTPVQPPQLQEALSEILSRVYGAGEVEVLLTQEKGEEILYQSDLDTSTGKNRSDTVLISGTDRTESGLIRQINSPTYLGAVVLCQGADNAAVRLAIVQAVMSVTGLTSDHITVLKMK